MRLYEIVITQSNGKEIVLLGSHPEIVILPSDENSTETVLLGDPKETQLNPVVLTDVIVIRDDTEVIIEPARGPQGPPGSSGNVNVVTWTLPCDPPEQEILDAINTAEPPLYVGVSDFLIIKHCGIDYLYSGPLDVTIGLGGDYTVLQADITSITAGINNHPELAGLTDPDQHPQEAIIGLVTGQAIQDAALVEHTSRTDNPHEVDWDELQGTQPQPQPHLHTESEITDLDKYTQAEVDASQGLQDTAIGNNATAISNHVADLANPHAVTYEQLGGTQPAPVAHQHTESEITDLDKYTQAEIDTQQGIQDQNLVDHESDLANPHQVSYTQTGGAPLSHTHTESQITDLDKYSQSEIDTQQGIQDQNLVDHETAYNPHAKMNWKNVWTSIQYYTHDVVYDDGYAMVANKDTTDRAAPQAIGDPIAAYTGAAPTTQTIAKQVISGVRTTAAIDAYINAYDVYVIAGNQYDIFSIIDPLGLGEINSFGSFTAATTGWIQFSISPLLILAGTVFDLISLVKEPAPSPTTWTGNWNYLTPNNASTPAAGQISHADKATNELRINIVDDDGGNRSAELLALTVGDTVSRGGTTWAIQAIINNTSFITFSIAPQVQDAPDGVEEITFETVTATPITYVRDVDYWLTSPATSFQGLEGVDIPLGNLVPDDNAYGINFELQEASISDDWDLLSAPGGGGGGGDSGGGGLTDAPEDGTFYGRKDALWVNPEQADIPGLEEGLEGKQFAENGFVDRAQSVMSFDDVTKTFTIAPTGTDFEFYAGGQHFVTTGDSIVIGDVEGMWFIYYDTNGVIQATQVFNDYIITTWAFMALVYWSVSTQTHLTLAEERHGNTMDSATHLYNHNTTGARYGSGCQVNTITSDGNGDDEEDAQLGVGSGVIWDEDIKNLLADHPFPANIPLIWREGVEGHWLTDETSTYVCQSAGTGRGAYNEFTGATWQLTEVSNNDFFLMHLYATNDIDDGYFWITGQNEYATTALAREGATAEILKLETGGILIVEYKAIATIILQTSNQYSNAVQSRVVPTDTDGHEYIDWRFIQAGVSLSVSGAVGTIWGDIAGTIANQADLQLELDGKSDVGHAHAGEYLPAAGVSTDPDNVSILGTDSLIWTPAVAGEQGPPGEDGADGADGAQGIPGDDGADGATGPEGPTAVSTDADNTAVLGTDSLIYVPAGGGSNVAIGPTPPGSPSEGDQWWDNSSGVGQMRIYYTDADTSQWVASNSGLKGDQGEAGPQGVQGPTGPQGDKGDTGDQGIQGIQGDQGVQGDQGDQGVQGLPGLDGDTPDVTTEDGKMYGRIWNIGEVNPAWEPAAEEAPEDGEQYVRQDGAWTLVDLQGLGATSSQQGFNFSPNMAEGFDHWYQITAATITVTISPIFDQHWRFSVTCRADSLISVDPVITINLPTGKLLAPNGDNAVIGFVSVEVNVFDVFGDLADG